MSWKRTQETKRRIKNLVKNSNLDDRVSIKNLEKLWPKEWGQKMYLSAHKENRIFHWNKAISWRQKKESYNDI